MTKLAASAGLKYLFKNNMYHIKLFVSTFLVVGLVTASNTNPSLHMMVGNLPLENTESDRSSAAIQVGEIESVDFFISYQDDSRWEHSITYPGAAYIKVHFLKMELRDKDYITVSDPQGLQVHTYPGSGSTTDGQSGFWGLSILGDTALIKLHSGKEDGGAQPKRHADIFRDASVEESVSELGVKIDQFAHGYPHIEIQRRIDAVEDSCGTNQRIDVVCYQGSHPIEYQKADAVGLLLLNGIKICTTWRASPLNRVFTNEHCVTSQTDIDNSEIWFNYQRLTCGSVSPQIPTIVSGGEFLTDDYTLDFALFTVDNFQSISGFGYLELDDRSPILAEEIYIPQHGEGNPKQFGIESDMNSGNVCRIDDTTRNGVGPGTDAGYYCDVIGGSSGSPVLARSSHKVIAIHHFGPMGSLCNASSMNQGVRIDRIWPLVESYLQVQFQTYLPLIIQ